MSTIFVLSAGRTGTVFLTKTLPAHLPGLQATHERPGSRTTLMLGNLVARLQHGDALNRARLKAWLLPRLAEVPAGQVQLELNPMLCSVAHLLPELVQPLHIVHLVRHPIAWTQSMRAFKASSRLRPVIDYVPFAHPAPTPPPPRWHRADQVTRTLWRWRACNEALEALAPRATAYTRLRHEDLFQGPPEARVPHLKALLTALQQPIPDDLSPLLDAAPANPAPKVPPAPVDLDLARQICGSLAERYNYTI